MSTDNCTITIHMVSSLDGFIAKPDNSVGWFETTSDYEKGAVAPDVTAFLKTIDCYVMGARTYELALELSQQYGWPYGDTPTVVLTHRNLPVARVNVQLYAGELQQLVQEKLNPLYKNVWVVGGAELANQFVRLQLAHAIRMTVLPIMLGSGKRFFGASNPEQPLHLKDVTAYKNGMVDLWYEIRNR